ncbi:MAG: hypothetical protein ACO1RX_19355 [Candidatus Sericytochromatia bacterium]
MGLQSERLHPVYCLGDSHVAIFNYLLLERTDSPTQPARRILSRALFVPELRAAQLMQGPQRPHPQVLQALQQERLLQAGGPEEGLVRQLLLRQSPEPPVLLVHCGFLDLLHLQRQCGRAYDVWLPEIDLPEAPGTQLLPRETVVAQIQQNLQALEQGLRWLSSLGFRLALHDLPPTGGSENDFARLTGVDCPWPVRTRLALLFNQALAALAQRLGIVHIALWEQVSTAHRLKAEYLMDGLHLNRRAAELSLGHLLEALAPPKQESYEQALELLATLESLARSQQWQALLDHLAPVPAPLASTAPERTLWEQIEKRRRQAQQALLQA